MAHSPEAAASLFCILIFNQRPLVIFSLSRSLSPAESVWEGDASDWENARFLPLFFPNELLRWLRRDHALDT